MANRIRFTVKGDPTSVSATAQFTLGSIDLAAIPGFGSITAINRWAAVMRTWVAALHNGGEHGIRVYELVAACTRNSSGGINIGNVVAANAAASGVLVSQSSGTPPSGTFLWDNSSDVFRFRTTPGTTHSTTWMATHDVELFIP